MVTDRTNPSAFAEHQKALARRVVQGILTVSALTLPSLSAWSMDSPHKAPTPVNQFEISLPAVSYIDTMPWLEWRVGASSMKIDTLFVPTFDPSGIKLAPAQRDEVGPATS
jgi:hypothetical protein